MIKAKLLKIYLSETPTRQFLFKDILSDNFDCEVKIIATKVSNEDELKQLEQPENLLFGWYYNKKLNTTIELDEPSKLHFSFDPQVIFNLLENRALPNKSLVANKSFDVFKTQIILYPNPTKLEQNNSPLIQEYLIQIFPALAKKPTVEFKSQSHINFPQPQASGNWQPLTTLSLTGDVTYPLQSDFNGTVEIRVKKNNDYIPTRYFNLFDEKNREISDHTNKENFVQKTAIQLFMGQSQKIIVKLAFGLDLISNPVDTDQYDIEAIVKPEFGKNQFNSVFIETSQRCLIQHIDYPCYFSLKCQNHIGIDYSYDLNKFLTDSSQTLDLSNKPLYFPINHEENDFPIDFILQLTNPYQIDQGQIQITTEWTSIDNQEFKDQIDIYLKHQNSSPIVLTNDLNPIAFSNKLQVNTSRLDIIQIKQPQFKLRLVLRFKQNNKEQIININAVLKLHTQSDSETERKLCIDFGTAAIALAITGENFLQLGHILKKYDNNHDEKHSGLIASYVGISEAAEQTLKFDKDLTAREEIKHWKTDWKLNPKQRLCDIKQSYHLSVPFIPASKLQESTDEIVFGLKSSFGANQSIITLNKPIKKCSNGVFIDDKELNIHDLISQSFFELADFYLTPKQKKMVRRGRLILTTPNSFAPHQEKKLQQMVKPLCQSLKINEDKIQLISESDASAYYFLTHHPIKKQKEGHSIRTLIIDFGGGTLDLSVIDSQWEKELHSHTPRQWKVISRMGVPLGGNVIDEMIAYIIHYQLTTLINKNKKEEKADKWQYVNKLTEEKGQFFKQAVTTFRANLMAAKVDLSQQISKKPTYRWDHEVFKVRVGTPNNPLQLVTVSGYKENPSIEENGAKLSVEPIKRVVDDQTFIEEGIFLTLEKSVFECEAMQKLLNFVCKRVIEVALFDIKSKNKIMTGEQIDRVIVSGRASLWPPIYEKIRDTLESKPINSKSDVLPKKPFSADELKYSVVQGAVDWDAVDKGVIFDLDLKQDVFLALKQNQNMAEFTTGKKLIFERDWERIDLSSIDMIEFLIAPEGATDEDYNDKTYGHLLFIQTNWMERRESLGYTTIHHHVKLEKKNDNDGLYIRLENNQLLRYRANLNQKLYLPPWPLVKKTLEKNKYSGSELKPFKDRSSQFKI